MQSDPNTLPISARTTLLADPNRTEEEKRVLGPNEQFAHPRANGYWSSCIQVVDPLANVEEGEDPIAYTIPMTDNEAALSCAMVPFENQDGEVFLLVGTGKHMRPPGPPDASKPPITGSVHVYRVLAPGKELELAIEHSDFAP